MTSPTENKIRLTAFFVFILTLIFIKTELIYIPVFLASDFFLRAFGYGKFSLLGILSSAFSSLLKLKRKPIFFPPKQFAAKVGFAFSLALIVLSYYEINTLYVAIILALCAGMEAFLNFCTGCYIYNLFHSLKHRI